MPTTTTRTARATRSTRTKAAQAACHAAVLAYHASIDSVNKIADLGLESTEAAAFNEFAVERMDIAEAFLVDAIIEAGRPFEFGGYRYEATSDFDLHVKAL